MQKSVKSEILVGFVCTPVDSSKSSKINITNCHLQQLYTVLPYLILIISSHPFPIRWYQSKNSSEVSRSLPVKDRKLVCRGMMVLNVL